jgi:hypothetical protein
VDGRRETEAQLEHILLLKSSDIDRLIIACLIQIMPPVPATEV